MSVDWKVLNCPAGKYLWINYLSFLDSNFELSSPFSRGDSYRYSTVLIHTLTLLVVKDTPHSSSSSDSPHSHPYFIGGKRHTTLQLQLRSSSAAAPHRLRTGSVPAPHQLRTSSAAAPHQLHTESRSFGIFHSSGLAESAYFQSDNFCWGFVQSIEKKQIFVIMVVKKCK